MRKKLTRGMRIGKFLSGALSVVLCGYYGYHDRIGLTVFWGFWWATMTMEVLSYET